MYGMCYMENYTVIKGNILVVAIHIWTERMQTEARFVLPPYPTFGP